MFFDGGTLPHPGNGRAPQFSVFPKPSRTIYALGNHDTVFWKKMPLRHSVMRWNVFRVPQRSMMSGSPRLQTLKVNVSILLPMMLF